MPLFKVTETRTVTLTHVIQARSARQAEDHMRSDAHVGLVDILEDDAESEYEVVSVEKCGTCNGFGSAKKGVPCEVCSGEGYVHKE